MEEKTKVNKKKLIIAVVGAIIAIVAAIVCVVVFVGGDESETDGETQKQSTVVVNDNLPVAATYGDVSVSQVEYSYGYMSLYNQVLTVVEQYNSYYSGYGSQYYDVTLSPSEQDCPSSELPEGVETWADYFAYYAAERAVLIKYLYETAMSDEAAAKGFSITTAQQNEVDENIEEFISSLEEKASADGVTVDEYIASFCGYGLTSAIYKEQLEREYVAELYLYWYQSYLSDNISQEDIDTYYFQNQEDIEIVTFRAFALSYAEDDSESTESSYTKSEAESLATDFINKAFDEESFIDTCVEFADDSMKETYKESSATLLANYTKSDLVQVSSEMAEWLFADGRELYDLTCIDIPEQESYYVIMVTELPARDISCTSADVRHLLVEYGDDKEAALLEAESIFQLWEENGATEDAFIELVKAHTDDTASAETGGLYEDINSSSSYVTEFLNWAIAPHNEGDAEIVATTYGYHIMYYVGGDPTPKWESDIRSALASLEYSNYYDDLYNDISGNIVIVESVCSNVNEQNLLMIEKRQELGV